MSVYVIEVGFPTAQGYDTDRGGHLLADGTVGAGVVRTFPDKETADGAARELLRDLPGCQTWVECWEEGPADMPAYQIQGSCGGSEWCEFGVPYADEALAGVAVRSLQARFAGAVPPQEFRIVPVWG